MAQPLLPRHSRPLLERDAAPDPFAQFSAWYSDTVGHVRVPEAVALATATAECRPSVRMVLMKGWDESGFVFYTNYASRKGIELAQNPRAAMLFHWDAFGRQVRIEGVVSRVSEGESDLYFATRPFGAKVGAWASRQSKPVADRATLDDRVRALTEAYAQTEVPRPQWWGGYRLAPDVVEFWQSREDRLHDRILYSRPTPGASWLLQRIQP